MAASLDYQEAIMIAQPASTELMSKTGSYESQSSTMAAGSKLKPRGIGRKAAPGLRLGATRGSREDKNDQHNIKQLKLTSQVPADLTEQLRALVSQWSTSTNQPTLPDQPEASTRADTKRGVRRDFKVLVPLVAAKGYNSSKDSHIRRFNRQRSKTLVQQLAVERYRNKTFGRVRTTRNSKDSTRVALPEQKEEDKGQLRPISEEFLSPLRVVQESMEAVATIQKQSNQRVWSKARRGPSEQVSDRPRSPKTDTEKITIDTMGIQQLARVANQAEDASLEVPDRGQGSSPKASARRGSQSALDKPCDRLLFDLPTSVVEDLFKEQREHDEATVVPFGIIGVKPQIKPLKEHQKKQRPYIQESFREKKLRQQILENFSLLNQGTLTATGSANAKAHL